MLKSYLIKRIYKQMFRNFSSVLAIDKKSLPSLIPSSALLLPTPVFFFSNFSHSKIMCIFWHSPAECSSKKVVTISRLWKNNRNLALEGQQECLTEKRSWEKMVCQTQRLSYFWTMIFQVFDKLIFLGCRFIVGSGSIQPPWHFPIDSYSKQVVQHWELC